MGKMQPRSTSSDFHPLSLGTDACTAQIDDNMCTFFMFTLFYKRCVYQFSTNLNVLYLIQNKIIYSDGFIKMTFSNQGYVCMRIKYIQTSIQVTKCTAYFFSTMFQL